MRTAGELSPEFLTLIGNRLLVQVVQIDETVGGIALPQTAARGSSETPTGWVVSVGPYCRLVERGDLVLVHEKTLGASVVYNRQRFMLFDENQLVAIVNGQRHPEAQPRSRPIGSLRDLPKDAGREVMNPYAGL